MPNDVRRAGQSPHEALPLILAAVHRNPSNPRSHLDHARCLLALGRLREAGEAASTALGFAPQDAALLDAIGGVLNLAGSHRDALAAYDRAVGLAREQAHFLFNRAAVHRFLGNLDQAEHDYDRVIALRPADFEAWRNRSELRVQTPAKNHIAPMEALLAGISGNWQGEVYLRHALAKEYEDLGHHEQSFSHLERGARLHRAHLRYDPAVDVETVDWLIHSYPEMDARDTEIGDAGSGAAAASADGPIFILGMPRSGSTLVERILSSHSKVVSGGELPHFAMALVDAVKALSAGAKLTRREMVERSAQLDFGALGRDYLQRVRAAGIESPTFIDKMPLNYLYSGLILRAIPQARIVHVMRDPMAACYAMYKTLFRDGYPFSYDVRELAQVYAAYRRLMRHWESSFPGRIHVVSYERFVRNPSDETRGLLGRLGLPWEDACLDFHLNPTPSTTASAVQVRRTVYDTSVNQWRHYERQLQALRDCLLVAGVPLEGTAS